ncbi:2-hydroxychromene-2-carboxylate isomerase [compost metagenome]
MVEVLTQHGFDPNEVLALTADEEVKAVLKDNTEKAVQRGVFGAPSMFVDNQLFFGQDRLDFVVEALR